MSTTEAIWTFVLGKRIGNAPPPMFLKFRSSETFIICTIMVAVFTVILIPSPNLDQTLTKPGYVLVRNGGSNPTFHVSREGCSR